MSESRKVTAVIVTYQSRETIGHTLDALAPACDSGFASCVVVDNASSDGTADYIAEQYPWVEIIPSPENLGFGRGCNLGFESVGTPYALFLNPDASIGLAGLEVLVDFIDSHPRAGIVGPSTEIKGWGYQSAGMMLTPARLIGASLGARDMHPGARVIEPGGAPFQTNWICGAVFMIRSSLFRKLGGFDPRFFLYFEETDLCLRVAREGMELWAVGEALSEHLAGYSTRHSGEEMTGEPIGASVARYFYPSRFYYLGKNFGWPSAILAEIVSAVMDWVREESSPVQRHMRPFMKLPDRSS
jgi:GT2 family glycosyltransferase